MESVPLYDAITFHKSRKTFITTALRRGISQRIVMQLAGIKTESTFRKYAAYENIEGDVEMHGNFSRGEESDPMAILDVLDNLIP